MNSIVVFGNGLAAYQTALMLRKKLAAEIAITLVSGSGDCQSDEMYGTLTSPSTYAFNLAAHVDERELLLQSRTAFSFGTHYENLGKSKLSWMQCFHLPFKAEAGVPFHHFVTRHKARLSDYLISAQAAAHGRFAHPPQDNARSALSRAEYGYQFNPYEWTRLWENKIEQENISVIRTDIESVEIGKQGINKILLTNHTAIEADFYIDCTGTAATVISKLDNEFEILRNIQISSKLSETKETGPAYRKIVFNESGWEARANLQQTELTLTLTEEAYIADSVNMNRYCLGYKPRPWVANCVAIGHAAWAIEPVTHAPLELLNKDISRLLDLLPINASMTIESKEYNRRYLLDIMNAELFHKAMYWQQRDVGYAHCGKLQRKLEQFEHRGIVASFDFELFNQEDWIILHNGMNRVPKVYDPLADNVSWSDMETKLTAMKNGIIHLARQMPPHHIYLEKLKQYLRETHG